MLHNALEATKRSHTNFPSVCGGNRPEVITSHALATAQHRGAGRRILQDPMQTHAPLLVGTPPGRGQPGIAEHLSLEDHTLGSRQEEQRPLTDFLKRFPEPPPPLARWMEPFIMARRAR
jgi:hypothetical protein